MELAGELRCIRFPLSTTILYHPHLLGHGQCLIVRNPQPQTLCFPLILSNEIIELSHPVFFDMPPPRLRGAPPQPFVNRGRPSEAHLRDIMIELFQHPLVAEKASIPESSYIPLESSFNNLDHGQYRTSKKRRCVRSGGKLRGREGQRVWAGDPAMEEFRQYGTIL